MPHPLLYIIVPVCHCAEGLHFSAFYYTSDIRSGNTNSAQTQGDGGSAGALKCHFCTDPPPAVHLLYKSRLSAVETASWICVPVARPLLYKSRLSTVETASWICVSVARPRPASLFMSSVVLLGTSSPPFNLPCRTQGKANKSTTPRIHTYIHTP